MNTQKLLIKRLTSTALIPTRGTSGSVGYDCYADVPGYNTERGLLIPAGERRMVPLGFAMMPPAGTYGRLAPRSGLALKNGLHVMAGVIDPDYTGLVSVILLNTDDQAFRIRHHDRVCQMLLEHVCVAEIQEVNVLTLTERASDGFGSTGV